MDTELDNADLEEEYRRSMRAFCEIQQSAIVRRQYGAAAFANARAAVSTAYPEPQTAQNSAQRASSNADSGLPRSSEAFGNADIILVGGSGPRAGLVRNVTLPNTASSGHRPSSLVPGGSVGIRVEPG